MKAILLFTSLFIAGSLRSQNLILHDPVSKKVFNTDKYAGINGSSFLYDEWITGRVTTAKGTSDTLGLKLDMYSNIAYLNKDGKPYEIEDEIKSIVLMPFTFDSATYRYFKKGLSGNNLKPDQFVMVLIEGKISLYRSDIKMVSEVNEINVGVVKTFSNYTRYFLVKNGTTQLIKLNKKEVMDIAKDKEQQIESYISKNQLSTKKETDLLLILKYYNTL